MKLKSEIITKVDWLLGYADEAHKDLFGEKDLEVMPFFDFAVLITNEKGESLTYGLAKEVDRDSLYFTYGGMFSKFRAQKMGQECFRAVIEAAKFNYKRAAFATHFENVGMQMLGLKEGFKIVGMRLIKKVPYVELLKEF